MTALIRQHPLHRGVFPGSTLFRQAYLSSVEAGRHHEITRIVSRALKLKERAGETVEAFLLRVYLRMLESYRGEYVYKNEVINRFILAQPDSDMGAVLTEYLIAGSHGRVDLVNVGQTTTSFEVKSDRDDLGRLAGQLSLAMKVFDRIYVVCPERNVGKIERAHRDVGVMVLDGGGNLTLVREAPSNASNVDPGTIFLNLRTCDYQQIIVRLFGELPKVSAVQMWGECRALFASLPPEVAHAAFLGVLRDRFALPPEAGSWGGVPPHLTHLYYSIGPRHRRRFLSPHILQRPAQ